jgi:hypothetical protein
MLSTEEQVAQAMGRAEIQAKEENSPSRLLGSAD